MWNWLTSFFLLMVCCQSVDAQRLYFDRTGKSTDQANSYYYRELTESPDSYHSYYSSDDSDYFVGRILSASESDESLNRYTGQCTWFYKNGKKKVVQEYNEQGELEGKATYYYESGRVWKEYSYKKGRSADSYHVEYDEDGERTKVFEDNFESNFNDWDIYAGPKSESRFETGKLVLTALDNRGTVRYINIQAESDEYSLEGKVNIRWVKYGQKAGLVFGFKDWENYWYFMISKEAYYIGNVYEGILTEKASGSYCTDIHYEKDNIVKVITKGEKFFFSINGTMQHSCAKTKLSGRNFGFVVTGKASKASFDDLVFKEFGTSSGDIAPNDEQIRSTGTGLLISKDGYIVTNHHVIDGVKETFVEISQGSGIETYKTRIVQQDKANDLAILKVDDPKFKPLESIRYSLRTAGGIEVGAPVYTIGFPLALAGLGKEPKFSDGKISAKTGYENAVNSFQTTIGVQPGNSGGPLFNFKGELIGIINASVTNTDNVSYAIKVSNLSNLMDLVSDIDPLPEVSALQTSPQEDQIKEVTRYVVLLKSK
jgi:hypothetical protein